MIVEKMTDLIGNTPMLKLDPAVTGLKNIDLYAKLEMLNPFGSVKDRTAWGMIKDDLEAIKANNMTIYENSSGNTAKSMQAIAGMHGVKFCLVSALAKVEEQKQVLQILGSEIEEIAGASDCFDPTDSNDPQYLIERTAKGRPGEIYFPSQFTNTKNPAYHEETTAEEILADLARVDYFFGGLGTTGSTLGISRRLTVKNPDMQTIAIVAKKNQFIPGIRSLSQMWESKLFKREAYQDFVHVGEQEAIDGLLVLARRCGVLCGVSSGANYHAAIEYLRTIDDSLTERKSAVFIVCDRMEWYISFLKSCRPQLFSEPKIENGISEFIDDPRAIVPEVRPEQLETFMQDHPLIIDLRTPLSFVMRQLPGSINVPQEAFRGLVNGYNPFPAGKKVLLVCAVGDNSRYYANYLCALGCDAYNLRGGVMSWCDLSREAA
ncbi:MAG: pyridoxal-phosphate dependent enzyme [Micavibrio sp.]